jgi:hypothetical protein
VYNCVEHCVSFVDCLADAGYLVLYPEEVARLKEIVARGNTSELLDFVRDILTI